MKLGLDTSEVAEDGERDNDIRDRYRQQQDADDFEPAHVFLQRGPSF
ncbi:MAG: hypothetical protein JNL40_13425 [Cyclobacteriaceae bacterium]|nr:hypothetical protein [Cyclobacteriaceae bacterium]